MVEVRAAQGALGARDRKHGLATVAAGFPVDPTTFSDKQRSIVQRLIPSLRRKATETVIVTIVSQTSTAAVTPPRGPFADDGNRCRFT